MGRLVRASLVFLFCLAPFREPLVWPAGTDEPCDKRVSVTVHPEEYATGTSLTDLMSKLIAAGRRMAVEQVTTTQVLSKSNEMTRNEDISFKSDTSQRFRGTVISHEILEREPGRIGSRETLRVKMRVNVCVTPADQVWYVRIEDVGSETYGPFEWMKSRFHSPTEQIQLVRSARLRAGEAAYKMHGWAFSERLSVQNYTNRKDTQAYYNCVKKQRARARNSQRVLGALGLGDVGRILEGLTSGAGSCGDPPERVAGRRLEAEAIFQIKICDAHSGDCLTVRQPFDFQRSVRTEKDKKVALLEFYQEGFRLVGAIALQRLQRNLGMLDK